ncbi:hypothetical protein UFOVP228_75 [uncultured Caudovirales phage]|uniref:Uncharacterized protein n=1 Tax=uncultured Caudovirales phage TaxID=2100421 RepID=A0A6J7WRN6_9CAUD|nr:hypothetical protein UFOVP47_27 [uncultured Caudovirales phage]CAB5219468.1 hypothetical protein UFOVP228_75 [uncultured Caudovirales phage]
MLYWLVQFKDGSFGYQVMSPTETVVTNIEGLVLTGNLEYTTVDVNPPEPYPAVTYA